MYFVVTRRWFQSRKHDKESAVVFHLRDPTVPGNRPLGAGEAFGQPVDR